MTARSKPSNWCLLAESKGAMRFAPKSLRTGENLIGTSSKCYFRLPTRKTSTKHCTIDVSDTVVQLEDMSTNGTYVNHSKHHACRHFLHDGDLIAFGQNTFKVDKDDMDILIFRLKRHESSDTIDLSDDDGEPSRIKTEFKMEIKTEFKAEKSDDDCNNNIEIDDDLPEDAYGWSRDDMAMDRLNIEPTMDDENQYAFEDSSTPPPFTPPPLTPPPATPPPSTPMPSTLTPSTPMPSTSTAIDIEKNIDVRDIAVKIKEEIHWNTFDYELVRHQVPEAQKPETRSHKVIATLEISSDEDDAQAPTPPPDSKRRKTINVERFDYEEMWPEMKAIPKRVVKKTVDVKPKKQEIEIPEIERNRLIDAVHLKPEYVTPGVHVVAHTRANRLALDFLGLDTSKAAASKPFAGKKSKPQSQSINNAKVETLLLEDECDRPCKWTDSPHANRLISKITTFSAKWLIEQNTEAPVCDDNFEPCPIPNTFDSVDTYRSTWTNLAKMELWDLILFNFRRVKLCRSVLAHVMNVKYVKRHQDAERYVFFCEAKINQDDDRSLLYVDWLVFIVHASGKFLAVITEMQCCRVENKLKMTFQMEAAKGTSSELMSKITVGKPKLISIKPIINIRIDLEQFNALMAINESPLCRRILRPSIDSLHVNNSCQDDVTNALYQKCKEAVLAKRRAIYVIEGDAGTGKTAILQQALVKLFSDEKVIRDARILFCSATNLSLNHVNYVIYEKRRDFPKKFVRFGHTEFIHPSVYSHSIPAHDLGDKDKAEINRAHLVFTTPNLVTELAKHSTRNFDLCFVDEASTLSELMMMPLLKLKINVLVLAGIKQLQVAAIRSPICREMKFGRSLITRMIDSCDSGPSSYSTLYEQYRMHPEIASWPIKHIHGNDMAIASVHNELNLSFRLHPYTVFSFHKKVGSETKVIEEILSRCMPFTESIGIIPESEQSKKSLEAWKKEALIGEQVEVSGHDCFQGTERDTILITAFKPTTFEYLNSPQQIHLALTRARRCLIFCANFDKVKDVKIWKSFLDDAKARGRLFEIRDDHFDFQSKLVEAQA